MCSGKYSQSLSDPGLWPEPGIRQLSKKATRDVGFLKSFASTRIKTRNWNESILVVSKFLRYFQDFLALILRQSTAYSRAKQRSLFQEKVKSKFRARCTRLRPLLSFLQCNSIQWCSSQKQYSSRFIRTTHLRQISLKNEITAAACIF